MEIIIKNEAGRDLYKTHNGQVPREGDDISVFGIFGKVLNVQWSIDEENSFKAYVQTTIKLG